MHINGDAISPVRERRQAMFWAGLEMLGLAIIVYGPAVVGVAIGRPMTWAIAVGGLGGMLIIYVPIQAAECLGPAVRITEYYGDYLTGKTITGWRSVDLRQISTLRYRNSPAPGRAPGRIMVTDTSGAILGVQTNDPDMLEAIRDALPRSLGRTIRISPGAVSTLGLSPDREPPRGYEPAPCRDQGTLLRGVTFGLLHFFAYVAFFSVVSVGMDVQ